MLSDLSTRVNAPEWMDDLSGTDDRLFGALRDLRWTNRLLGGYAATDAVLDPLLKRRAHCRLLDVGTGDGEFVARLVRRGARFGCRLEVVGLDANPTIVDYARRTLDDALPPALRERASIVVGDALNLTALAPPAGAASGEPPGAASVSSASDHPSDPSEAPFDVVHASLFVHHFFGDALLQVLREMQRASRLGIVVNDLHRHPVAYAAIAGLVACLPVSAMYRHDARASVRRGFDRSDFHALFDAAGLPPARIRWHWAFRWTVDTLPGTGGR